MRTLLGLFLVSLPIQSFARWNTDELINETGDGFLLWIPIGVAGYLYNKFDDSGRGGLAATLGGGASLILVLIAPLAMTLVILVAFALWLIVRFLKRP